MKIRQYWEFTKWNFRNWSIGNWLWFIACGLLGAAAAEPDPEIYRIQLSISMSIVIGLFIRYVVIDVIRSEFARFKKSRTDLFKTIDEGK